MVMTIAIIKYLFQFIIFTISKQSWEDAIIDFNYNIMTKVP